MANQNPVQNPVQLPAVALPIQILGEHFDRLQNEIRAHSLCRDTKTFSGESTTRLKMWLKDMEKFQQIINGDGQRMRVFAIKTLTGVAGDYLRRLLQQHPQAQWDQIKDAIVARFSDLADQNYALKRLRQIRQNTGESVQVYGERVLSLAEDAYPGQPVNQPALQREMIDIFVSGLADDGIVKKLLRNRPVDVYAAIESAMVEQGVNRVFKAQRRKEEPMEVDSVQPQSNMYKELSSKMDILATSMVQLTDMQRQQSTQSQGPRNYTSTRYRGVRPHKYTQNGKPICDYCDKPNHVYKNCFKRQSDDRNKGKGPSQTTNKHGQKQGNARTMRGPPDSQVFHPRE